MCLMVMKCKMVGLQRGWGREIVKGFELAKGGSGISVPFIQKSVECSVYTQNV